MQQYTFQILFLKFILLFSLASLFGLMYYYTRPKKRDLFKYKLEYFYLNWFFVLLYIIAYLGLILYLRISQLSEISDLSISLKLVTDTYNSKTLFDFIYLSILFIFFLINIMYIFYLIHQFFITQIIKCFLVLCSFLDRFLEPYTIIWFQARLEDALEFLIYHPFKAYLSENLRRKVYLGCNTSARFIIMKVPTIILILFFVYEIYYNNYILSANFRQYLLFYFIYNTYKRISVFLNNTDDFICKMVYEMYYCQGSILYVNMPDELEEIVYNFVDNGLYRNPKTNPVPIIDDVLGLFCWTILSEYRYHSLDGYTYTSGHMQFVEDEPYYNV